MPRLLISASLLLALLPISLPAQTMTSYSNTGENILVPNMPFQAERITRSERKLADDSMQSREETETIDRDSAGRVLVESKVTSSGDLTPAKLSIFHELLDPVEGVSTSWSSLSTTATTRKISATNHVRIAAIPFENSENSAALRSSSTTQPTPEDLGKRTIVGLTATGTRVTTVISPGRMGNVKTLLISQETWFSPDLQMTLLEVDKSPFNGTRTSGIVSLTRDEPPAALFHIPEGYVIKPIAAVNLGTPSLAPGPTLPLP